MLRVKTNAFGIVNQTVHLHDIQNYYHILLSIIFLDFLQWRYYKKRDMEHDTRYEHETKLNI